jgi:hypothetical protein
VLERPSPKPPAPPTEATERLWHDPAHPGPAPEPPLAPPEFELPGGEEEQQAPGDTAGGDQLSLEDDAGGEPARRLRDDEPEAGGEPADAGDEPTRRLR